MSLPPADEVARALDELLPADQRTGDLIADCSAAAREAMRRRVVSTRHGGTAIAALRAQGLSWREVEGGTGIAQRTARRWAEGPPEVGD